jgi:hypothetical protein
MSQMWSGDTQSGLDFTFRMIMIGVSLAIGMFVGEFGLYDDITSINRVHTMMQP